MDKFGKEKRAEWFGAFFLCEERINLFGVQAVGDRPSFRNAGDEFVFFQNAHLVRDLGRGGAENLCEGGDGEPGRRTAKQDDDAVARQSANDANHCVSELHLFARQKFLQFFP